ncbi:phage tail protein [Ligilactobacillus saerimneri]|uniref:Phage tail protein n=1 Tax=Ligilactobacillus saerimneri TaxID=228229 RepID=A0A7H9EJA0_9LACO|nr:major tail protein [Ligilactobacillus saerimneri]QLL77783.1 phage tail protein [Ligilactobacillus saerimneri]
MATVGLKTTYVGIKGEDGNVILGLDKGGVSETGVFEIDNQKKNGNLGAVTANITGLSGTVTKISGNDSVVDVTNPPSAPSVALTYNQVNVAVKQALLGRKLENGGYVDTDNMVEAALLVETRDEIDNKAIFFAFPRGTFNETQQNIQTNTDTAQTRETEAMTFTALTSPILGNKPYKIYFETAEGFSKKKMFDEVFGSTQKFITEDTVALEH